MKRSNITKDEILKTINSSLGTPLSLSEKILNEILNIIVDGLNSVSYTHLTLPTIYSV